MGLVTPGLRPGLLHFAASRLYSETLDHQTATVNIERRTGNVTG